MSKMAVEKRNFIIADLKRFKIICRQHPKHQKIFQQAT